MNENQFFKLRKNLLSQLSLQQVIAVTSANRVHVSNNDDDDDNHDISEAIQIDTRSKQNDKFKNVIFIHPTYEGRFKGMKQDIHEIHDDVFKNTLTNEFRLVVGNRNKYNTDLELTQKRPHPSLLKTKLAKKKKKSESKYYKYTFNSTLYMILLFFFFLSFD